MLTGINFSPPLYFLLNFLSQLIYPTTIELLRFQSVFWLLIGAYLSFLLSRNLFGIFPATLSTILVVSQSKLLLSQAQEARHYTMFFACAAWVLYMLVESSNKRSSPKISFMTFLAHLSLCQIHYFGIIFSGMVGLALFISSTNRIWFLRVPKSIWSSWLVSVPIYLFLLSKQSSHLGNWPKPNGLGDLLSNYNDSFIFLSILVPLAGLLFTRHDSNEDSCKDIVESKECKIIFLTAVFWLAVPVIFWVLSHITTLNLFVDRYFITKEIAVIILVAYFSKLLFARHLKSQLSHFPLMITLFICVICITLNYKRSAYGLRKETNYHHSLIIKNSIPKSEKPIIIKDDPNFFPNAYLGHHKVVFQAESLEKENLYKQFSKRIKICRIK